MTKKCKLHLMGKQPKCRAEGKRAKITQLGVQFGNNVNDGYDIGGFKTNRVCEFEVDILNDNILLKIKIKSACIKNICLTFHFFGLSFDESSLK